MARTHHIAMAIGALAPVAIGAAAKIDLRPAPAPAPRPVAVVTVVATPTPQPSTAPVPGATPTPGATPLPVETPTSPPPIVSDVDPSQCLTRYAAMPLPYERGEDIAQRQTLVCRRTYLISYDSTTRDPSWVLERLAPGDLTGPNKRKDNFRQDPLLKGIDADLLDYSSPGPVHYDRGHQAPAADAKFSAVAMSNSFVLSNMAPQVGIGFNRGVWKYLEESIRAWVLCGGHSDLYVITGPVYGDHPGTIGHDKVAVPTQFFKIVYDPVSDRAVGFLLPNVKIGSSIPNLQVYVKSIAEIETETGLNFFGGWTFRHQTALEAQPGTAWGHIGTCPGDAGS